MRKKCPVPGRIRSSGCNTFCGLVYNSLFHNDSGLQISLESENPQSWVINSHSFHILLFSSAQSLDNKICICTFIYVIDGPLVQFLTRDWREVFVDFGTWLNWRVPISYVFLLVNSRDGNLMVLFNRFQKGRAHCTVSSSWIRFTLSVFNFFDPDGRYGRFYTVTGGPQSLWIIALKKLFKQCLLYNSFLVHSN